MKQHLEIKHFYGTSDEAVTNQVWISLIAFCLLALVKLETKVEHRLLHLARWLTMLLWQPCRTWILRLKKKPNRTKESFA